MAADGKPLLPDVTWEGVAADDGRRNAGVQGLLFRRSPIWGALYERKRGASKKQSDVRMAAVPKDACEASSGL